MLNFRITTRLDALYGFPGNSIKLRHESYRRFRDIEGLGGSEGTGSIGVIEDIGDISRDMR